MRIGILTYHRVINLGSVVQAWCVVKLARELFPDADVEVIDYRPLRTELREARKFIKRRKPFFNTRHLKKMRAIRGFVNENLPMSADSLLTDNTSKAIAWMQKKNYDIIFVGSDTVWELRDKAYSPGGTNAYFLPGLTKVRKCSISASMDPVPEFTAAQTKVLKQRIDHIKQFDLLTVRDESTLTTLVNEGVKRDQIIMLPDPTLMVSWSEIVAPKAPDRHHKPIAGVSLPPAKAFRVHKALKALGYDVWDWNGLQRGDVDYLMPPGLPVSEVLAKHKSVDLYVTDRFHGSIFTFVLGKAPVLFFEDPGKWPKKEGKGRHLFRTVGAGDLVYRDLSLLIKNIPSPSELVEVDQYLDELRTFGDGGRRQMQAYVTNLFDLSPGTARRAEG